MTDPELLYTDFTAAFKQRNIRECLKIWLRSCTYDPSFFVRHLLAKRHHNRIERRNKRLEATLGQRLRRRYNVFPVFGHTVKNKTEQPEIIVSLTSFPARFPILHIALKSLFNQTVRPNRIILYLDKDVSIKALPLRVRLLRFNGLEIKNNCEHIRPHKKYLYSLREHPDSVIVCVDDDLIYPRTMLAELLDSYKNHPNTVSARRVHRITRDNMGHVQPYEQWEFECKTISEPSHQLLATTGFGTLYPPGFMKPNDKCFDIENIQKYCLRADDIWIKFYELQENVPVVYAPNKKHSWPIENDSEKLCDTNLWEGQNDIFIHNCEKFFGFKAEVVFKKD